MQTKTNPHRIARLAAVMAALSVGASAALAAVDGAGEAQGVALPNVAHVTQSVSTTQWADSSTAYTSVASEGPLTRAQVRAELLTARSEGTLTQYGEAGDTPAVLAARENANRVQAENIVAQYRAEQEREIALAQAEEARLQLEQESSLEYMLSGYEQDWASSDASYDLSEARIDVIRMNLNTNPTLPEEELVVVAVEGGDPAEQEERALAIRRHLAAMGLAQNQIYIEATGA